MFIKLTTVRTKKKIYKYVKLLRRIGFYEFNRYDTGTKPPQEEVVATLGTLEDVLASKESIISGLNRLSESSGSSDRQKTIRSTGCRRTRKSPATRIKPTAKKSISKQASKNKQTKKRRK